MTIEHYGHFCHAVAQAAIHCDGLLASVQPLEDLRRSGSLGDRQRLYLSLNRTGLAGSIFELDDRLVVSVERAAALGLHGVKQMIRIDLSDPATAAGLELLGQVLEAASHAGLEALVEALVWRDGTVARDVESVILAAVVAHDMGAPLLKVPVPDVQAGAPRVAAVARVTSAVGVPVLFLGGPPDASGRDALLSQVSDVMGGGGAGMAIGRAIYQDPDPRAAAKEVAEIVHGGSP